jgi:hypothetical protein
MALSAAMFLVGLGLFYVILGLACAVTQRFLSIGLAFAHMALLCELAAAIALAIHFALGGTV